MSSTLEVTQSAIIVISLLCDILSTAEVASGRDVDHVAPHQPQNAWVIRTGKAGKRKYKKKETNLKHFIFAATSPNEPRSNSVTF